MQFVGLTCLVGLMAMTMFRSHLLDRQIDTMKRQRGCVSSVDGVVMAGQSPTEQAILRAEGQRVATLSSVVAVFILLILGCRGIDKVASWITFPGALRDTLILSLLLTFAFVTSLPSRYYGGRPPVGWTNRADTGARSYLSSQARILIAGMLLGVPLLWGLFTVAHAVRGLWWLYLWGSLVVALMMEPVLCGRVIIPGISVMMPAGRGVNDQIAALMKQLGFRNAGVFKWVPAAWAEDVGILVLGSGANRRVAIPANLLRSLSGDEITAMVAHDLGHGRLGHGSLQLVGRAVKLFVILGVFAWSATPAGSGPGNIPEAHAFSFLAALLLLDLVLTLLTLVEHAVERHVEFQADSFVNGLLGPEALTRALLKLSASGGHPMPDPLYSLINDRVPPAVLRVARLQETAPVLLPVEQADEAQPLIEQLSWIGRCGLLTFDGNAGVREPVVVASRLSPPAGEAKAKRKRPRGSPARGPKRARAALSATLSMV